MPVPSKMADLFTIAASNSPAGSDLIGNSLDDYIRSGFAILRSTNALASASIAAASTTDLSTADAESVQITGSATINSLGTAVPGLIRECRFAGSCVIAASASIALPGNANITTTAGDVITFRSLGSGNWTFVTAAASYGYLPLSGGTLSGNLTMTQGGNVNLILNKGSGSAVNIITGQAVGVNRWFLTLGNGTGNDDFSVQRCDNTGAFVDSPLFISRTSGQVTLTQRPLFGANTPWDSGNFNPSNYASLAGNNTLSGTNLFTGAMTSQKATSAWGLLCQDSTATAYGGLWIEAGGVALINTRHGFQGIHVTNSGNFTSDAAMSGPDFISTSDINLKDRIKRLSRGIAELKRMLPREYLKFDNRQRNGNGKEELGFIAQEVQEVVPEAVSTDMYGNLCVSHGQLLALIANAVLEIDQRLAKEGL